ncbi:MAG: VOC family protein [Acidimicrobiales bacterium]
MTDPVKFRFDHVGFITGDVDHAMDTFRALGMTTMERQYAPGEYDIGFLGAGVDVLFEFQGPPLLAESEEYVARQGHSIERIALSCDDVRQAYDNLTRAGLASAWEPEPFVVAGVTLAIAAGLWTPDGLMIDLVQLVDAEVPRPTRGQRGELALHHACYLTDDLARAEDFWVTHFGLTKTYDFTAPLDTEDPTGGTRGFIMLSDPDFDECDHEFSLEIIGGEFDSIDGPAYERRGPHFDHVCFTTVDVAGVWQRAVDAGVEPLSEPAYYPEYDATIAWLYDADGTHIELMSPVPEGVMVDAHTSGRCSNAWVDDWQRNPAVLPRTGGRPVDVAKDPS